MFSIIIPVKKINNYVKKNIKIINQINPKKTEIIIIVNSNENYLINSKLNLKIIESGPCSPGIKRDMGAKVAKGKFLILFDDDSFPQKNYFYNLTDLIKKTKYQAFAGPGVNPQKQTIDQKISGAFFLSRLGGGNIDRYVPTIKKIVSDWPSVNFIIKKNLFDSVGGFNTNYWPGEDTFLCDKLKKKNIKILYSPDLIVFHHRREGFFRHIKQINGYGFHRGYFARKYKKTSLKLIYFIPSIFFLTLVFLIVHSIYFKSFTYLLLLISVYVSVNIFSILEILKYEKFYIAIKTWPYLISSHITYGISFLRGFFTFRNINKDQKYLFRFK